MALGEIATIGDIENFRGYYMTDGLTSNRKNSSNIFKHGLNNIETFKKTRKGGKPHDRN